MLFDIDWKGMFVPNISILEIILRGSIMYVGLFVLLRVLLKRQSGGLGITDLLLVTLLADASQNGMAGEYRSVPNGLALAGTIMGWNYFFDWLSFNSPWFARLIEPKPLPLIRHGRMLRHNMKQELITEDDLLGQLREQGIGDPADVKLANIESDGRISVIKFDKDQHQPKDKPGT